MAEARGAGALSCSRSAAQASCALIASALISRASIHAFWLAANMSRRFCHPPTGVPAESSGLAEAVERPVHVASVSRVHWVPITIPDTLHTSCLSLSAYTLGQSAPKHTWQSPSGSGTMCGRPRRGLRTRIESPLANRSPVSSSSSEGPSSSPRASSRASSASAKSASMSMAARVGRSTLPSPARPRAAWLD